MTEIFSSILIFTGMAILVIGSLIFIVQAFEQHVGWGFSVLLIPFAALVFLFKFWSPRKWVRRAFMMRLTGIALILGGVVVAPPSSEYSIDSSQQFKQPSKVAMGNSEQFYRRSW